MSRPTSILFTICALLAATLCCGQDVSISGFVDDQQGQPIAYATVIVIQAQDSTIVQGVSTNEEGFFLVKGLSQDTYLLRVSFLGYNDVNRSFALTETVDIGTIVMEETSQMLNEVNIIAKKPTLTKEADRMVFNIQNTALIEGNMFQVLKSTPGILVLDNSITVKNIKPTVFINDKRVHLSDDELVQLMESSSANNIKSIEVITNPSAKYDAESGAVINIVMSKNLITGYRGNLFANYTQGVYPRYQAGMSHFFKSEKVNFFANYTYSDNKLNRGQDNIINYLNVDNLVDQTFISDVNRTTWSKTHNFNFNFDYAINDKNTLSLSSNMLVLPFFEYNILSNTDVFDAARNLDYFINSKNSTNDNKYNLGFDMDFVHQLKTAGEKISINAHYTTYNYQRDQNVLNDYFDSDQTFRQTTAFRTDNQQDTQINTLQSDYTLPLNDSSTFEAGIKGSNIQSTSNITRLNIENDSEVIDLNNTNAFDYDERIIAGYLNYSTQWKKLSVVAGLRAEQTNTKGVSVLDDVTNKQDYFEMFPTLSLSYAVTENISIYSNYKRSIERPDYQSLNPFQFFLNDYTIVAGNPNLQPAFSNHTVIGASLFEWLTIESYYKTTNASIYEIPRQDNENNTITYSVLNLDKTTDLGFEFLIYFDVTNRWSLYTASSFYNIKDEGDFNDARVSNDNWANYSIISNDFSFLKDKSLNVNFSLIHYTKDQIGLQIISPRLISDLAISKNVFNNQGVISLNVADLFNTQDYRTSTKYLRQSNSTFYDNDDRYIKLGFRYKFGNTNLSTNQRAKQQQETDRLERKEN